MGRRRWLGLRASSRPSSCLMRQDCRVPAMEPLPPAIQAGDAYGVSALFQLVRDGGVRLMRLASDHWLHGLAFLPSPSESRPDLVRERPSVAGKIVSDLHQPNQIFFRGFPNAQEIDRARSRIPGGAVELPYPPPRLSQGWAQAVHISLCGSARYPSLATPRFLTPLLLG